MASAGLTHIASAVDERFAEIDAVRRGEVAGAIPTGFSDIDKILQGGVRQSDLIILAGRPSMGKTALMLAMLLNMAEAGNPVGIFSLEMSMRGLVGRLLAMKAKVEAEAIRTGYVTTEQMEKLKAAGDALKQLPIFIDDSGGLRVKEMSERFKRQPVKALGVDYLQLVHDDAMAETERVTRISRDLKEFNKEAKIPFLVACQLSRQVEARRDKKPMLSDLRQSGQIEQDADVVLAVFRPEVYDDSPEFTGYAEGLVIKQRDGGLGTAKLSFAAKYSLFGNYSSGSPAVTPAAGDGDWSNLGD